MRYDFSLCRSALFKNKLIINGDEKINAADARLALRISVKLENAQFESQTKAKLGNSDIRTLVENTVNSKLAEYFEENAADVEKTTFLNNEAVFSSYTKENARSMQTII